jgi:hypothetical protein
MPFCAFLLAGWLAEPNNSSLLYTITHMLTLLNNQLCQVTNWSILFTMNSESTWLVIMKLLLDDVLSPGYIVHTN